MAKKLNEGLIVSCQALPDEPLYGGDTIVKMAYAAQLGGATGIRCLVEDIDSIIAKTEGKLPIIGLVKQCYPDSDIFITPTIKEAERLIQSKCDIIALDCTLGNRPCGEKLSDIIHYIRQHSKQFIMADVATLDEIIQAEKLGVDYISTTLRGYTNDTKNVKIPDMEFLKQARSVVQKSTLVAEGGIFDRRDLEAIVKLGINYVVIGSAITRPLLITKYFNEVFK